MKKFNLNLVDKYILKQVMETFFPGILVFTALVFASDQFLFLVKQISNYGIPFKVAFLAILLQLPYIIVFTIPMAILMAVIMTFNKLNTNNEITVLRACGITLRRLAMPVLIFSISASIVSFVISEYIVPAANTQARNLMTWALMHKSLPKDKNSFTFKEFGAGQQLKRLFYVNKYKDLSMQGVTVLDLTMPQVIQVIQAKQAEAAIDAWRFNDGVKYTISKNGKVMNTAAFGKTVINTNLNAAKLQSLRKAQELNYFELSKYIDKLEKTDKRQATTLEVLMHEKFSLPATCFLISIIGIPLAISPPRARFNRGLLFSILVIFVYYILRAVATSTGQAEVLDPLVAAWLPNAVVFLTGLYLFYRKEFLVS